jgi:DNA sulfur modification protein DndB
MTTSQIGNVNVVFFDSFQEAVTAAQQYAFGNQAHHFEGTLFTQGGRKMFSTAMPLERFVQIAEPHNVVVRKRSEKRGDERVLMATEGDSPEDVADTTNRPMDKDHVKTITKYLTHAAKVGQMYIVPPATLNLREAGVGTMFTVKGDSTIKPAILCLAQHARLEITDAQHRREGIHGALADPSARIRLLRDSIAVMMTFENDIAQVHQDFADASRTKPIPNSLVAVYDSRRPVNALAVQLTRTCRLFRHTIDATAKGSSLSAGSVKVWNTSVLRQLVKYAALNSREADDIWNEKFQAVYGADRSDERFARFQDFLAEFVEACTQDIPLFDNLARLAADDMSQVPKIRASGGGQILMTAPGMNILGALAYTMYQLAKHGSDIRVWTKKLGTLDWSYGGSLWQPYLMIEGKAKEGEEGKAKVSTSAKAVKDTVELVEQKVGLKKQEDGLAA